MSNAEKFKALGAGNGLTFPKAKTPAETRNRPNFKRNKKRRCWKWQVDNQTSNPVRKRDVKV